MSRLASITPAGATGKHLLTSRDATTGRKRVRCKCCGPPTGPGDCCGLMRCTPVVLGPDDLGIPFRISGSWTMNVEAQRWTGEIFRANYTAPAPVDATARTATAPGECVRYYGNALGIRTRAEHFAEVEAFADTAPNPPYVPPPSRATAWENFGFGSAVGGTPGYIDHAVRANAAAWINQIRTTYTGAAPSPIELSRPAAFVEMQRSHTDPSVVRTVAYLWTALDDPNPSTGSDHISYEELTASVTPFALGGACPTFVGLSFSLRAIQHSGQLQLGGLRSWRVTVEWSGTLSLNLSWGVCLERPPGDSIPAHMLQGAAFRSGGCCG